MIPTDEFLDVSQTLSLALELIVGPDDHLRLALERPSRLFRVPGIAACCELIVCDYGISLLAIEKPDLLLDILCASCGSIEWRGAVGPLLLIRVREGKGLSDGILLSRLPLLLFRDGLNISCFLILLLLITIYCQIDRRCIFVGS